MRIKRSFSLVIYKLYLKYTYPVLIAIGTNNVIYKRGNFYWLDLFVITMFFLAVTFAVILLPITVIITRLTEPFNENQLRILYFTLLALNFCFVAFLHKRNRIKPVFNRLNKLSLEEVKKIKWSYFLSFLLYYIVPMTLGFIFSFSL